MLRVAFNTLGCKVNQYETDAMRKLFEKEGFQVVKFDEISDVYVVNTCTVTAVSDKKSRQMLRRAIKLNPNAIVAATGCYSQSEPDKVRAIDGVDIIIGTADRNKIVEFVKDKFEKHQSQSIVSVDDVMKQREFENIDIDNSDDRTRVYMKIQDGCTQFCAYCKIPYARGPVRSRKIDEIGEEAARLANAGFKEVVLTGIHLASYGKDFKQDCASLIDAIRVVQHVDGIERIRLGSIEPSTVTEEFINGASGFNKLCPHFHLSLQSGCDKTLKAMNRKYTTTQFQNAVKALRNAFENVAITTDLIVGFPGEADQDFEQTLAFIKEQKFADMHIFKFSRREGTKAFDMPNQVPESVKDSRSERAIQGANQMKSDFMQAMINTNQEILVETIAQKDDGKSEAIGHTKNYVKVVADATLVRENEVVNVKIVGQQNDYLLGIYTKV